MNELEIVSGEYRHTEGLSYRVIGLAHPKENNQDLQEIGIALGVSGYEETGIVSGEQIKVSQTLQKVNSSASQLVFEKLQEFPAPDTIVVYEQLEQGKQYPAGQLWWRPPENFVKHFQLKT